MPLEDHFKTTVKAIIFDFDGVLLESNQIKIDAFKKLFAHRSDKIDDIIQYHLANMGVSRYVKFNHIYKHILKEPYSEKLGLALGDNFSRTVLMDIVKVPLVKGAKEFIINNHEKYSLFIASGTPEEELRNIIKVRDIERYFKGVYGSPKKKAIIVDEILRDNSFSYNQVVFVGDAETDREAAQQCNVGFILRRTPQNDAENYSDIIGKINDLSELEDLIEGL